MGHKRLTPDPVLPFAETLLGQRLCKMIPHGDHQRSHAIGSLVSNLFQTGVQPQMVSNGRTHVIAIKVFSFDL